MHIALTADPELPVPPKLYGGIERIIAMLAAEFTRRGHDVTLFAHRDSAAAGDLVPWPGLGSRSKFDTFRNAEILLRESKRRRVDIIHSFSRIAYLLPQLAGSTPKLMSYQRPISQRSIQLAELLSHGRLEFTAISHWMIKPVKHIGRWHMIPNGVPLHTFPFVSDPGPEAPLMFLGRLEEIKGPHLAIKIAQQTGLPLVLAGNVPPEHQNWFNRYILPHLSSQIRYVGPVDDAEKAKLLGASRALLMPILWDEPFGIVMAEALACGTPVIGLSRGSVPEVIQHNETGFVANDEYEMIAYVHQLAHIDRHLCRHSVADRYSETVVANAYLSLYGELISRN